MAKKSDKSAGALDADKAGLLTGLFAEENEFDPRSLWRIGTWGVAAVGAVVLAVTSNQWSLGSKRDRLAAADLSRQARQIQSLTKDSQNETRRLAAAIDTLNNDRDRLFSRVTVLEQGLDSVTGTVAKRTAAIAASTAPKSPPSVAPPPATLMAATAPPADKSPPAASRPNQPGQTIPPATQASTTVAPTTVSSTTVSPTTVASTPAETPHTDAAKPDSAATIASLPQIAAIKPAVPLAPAAAPAPAPAAALGAPKSMSASPDRAVPKLVEAAKTAEPAPEAPTPHAPAKSPAAEVATAPPDAGNEDKASDKPEDKDQEKAAVAADGAKIQRTEFAVELGGANSIPGLRALWRGLMKSNRAELGELRPIIVLREGTNGLGMQLRLAAGPLQNAAEAARICAGLAERKRTCETTVFDGQRLAMGADEKPAASGKQPAAAAKPSSYRHYYPRHAKKEEPPPPPPKQESSTFSSLFGFNKH